MFGTAVKKTAILGLLAAGTTGALAAQEELRPSGTWNVPTCNRVVGTAAVTYTTDEGATLTPTTQPLTGVSYTAGLVALDTPNKLLAAVNSTILRSNNAGCRWSQVADLGPQAGNEILTLTAGAGERAFIWSDNRSLLFRYDGGTITRLRGTGTSIVGLAVDGRNGDRIRLGDDTGQIWESLDGGDSFQPVGAPAVQPGYWAYRVAFAPSNLDHAVAGTVVSGALVTFDGGRNWTPSAGVSKGSANVFNIVVSPADPSVVWAMGIDLAIADTDPSHGRFIYHSVDGGLTFAPRIPEDGFVKLINGPVMAAHPANPDVLYFIFGSSFQGYGTDLFRFDAAAGQLTVNHNAYHGIKAIEFSPASPSVMYLGLISEQIH
jgi:hypothetical protein